MTTYNAPRLQISVTANTSDTQTLVELENEIRKQCAALLQEKGGGQIEVKLIDVVSGQLDSP